MTDQEHPAASNKNFEQRNTNPHSSNVHNGIERRPNDANPDAKKQAPGVPNKPSIHVRLWKSLWRRRRWRKLSNKPPVKWTDVVTPLITFAILLVGIMQAYIYWRQAAVMTDSFRQNERAAILNMGQLAVAARNAKTSEETLGHVKSGGTDTHTLAQAAKKQAETAQTANLTTREALTSVQRAFVSFAGVISVTPEIQANKVVNLVFSIPWVNGGSTLLSTPTTGLIGRPSPETCQRISTLPI